jgi:hypothetical protein
VPLSAGWFCIGRALALASVRLRSGSPPCRDVVGDEAEGDWLAPEQVADVGREAVREAEAGDRTDDELDVDEGPLHAMCQQLSSIAHRPDRAAISAVEPCRSAAQTRTLMLKSVR